MSLVLLTSDETGLRPPSSVRAVVICSRATALSTGMTGMSPQSRIEAQLWYGLMLARALNPLNDVWREAAWRMARGPKRAPESVVLQRRVVLVD
jgi:hypothetical protein